MADTQKAATTVAVKPKTITLTFGEQDHDLYERILVDAKADRRSPSQFLVMHLAATYDGNPSND